MTLIRVAVAAACFLYAGVGTTASVAQGACAPFKTWEEMIVKAGEALVGVGMTAGSVPTRLYVSADSRTFTIIVAAPHSPGVWCGIAAGTDFDFVKPGKSNKEVRS